MVIKPSLRRYVLAVDRVKRLLRRTSDALNASGVDYAIFDGNAVATWVITGRLLIEFNRDFVARSKA